MAPKLKPFESTLHVLSGDSVGITCIATEGDTPISFLWTKDGSLTNSLLAMGISTSNPFLSVLGITEVTFDHRGLYSCIASNSVGFSSATVQLEVDGNFCVGFILRAILCLRYFKENNERHPWTMQRVDISSLIETIF